MAVYKKPEFAEFKKLIKNGHTRHWVQIAEALQINKNTVTRWKEHPEAKQAIIEGVSNAVENMERVGKNDWHMWREKLRMLGVQDKVDLEVGEKVDIVEEILKEYKLLDEHGDPMLE